MAYHEHRLKIFVSYSHKDDELRKKLTVQLRALKYADVWDDRVIGAGKEWHEEIISEVESADIILLLISSDFLASDYVNQVEIKKAFERHHAKTARVIPVLLAHCLWEHHEEISKLQAFPPDGKWVTAKKHWDSEAEALMSVVKGIEDAAKELREERQRHHDKQKTDEDTYRKKVAEMLSDDDRISEIERDILEDVRIDLKLSKEQASAIEAGELQPIEEKKKNIEKYEKTLKKTLERKGYPFGEAVQKDLEKVRGHLGLGPDDAVGVEKRVVGRWESERMVKEEADQMAKEDAERKAKEETERMAKEDAERTAKEDAERKAKEEAERKAKEETERMAKEDSERTAKEETERKTKEETERKAKEEADRKAKEEAERKAKEKADRKAKEEAEGKAKEQAEEAKALARVQGLQAFLLTWNAGEVNVLVAPDIPEKKLNNAIPRYEVPPTELVIGLIDATVFGSAKEGLIFGSQGVYFKNSDGSGPHAVPYSAFSSCNFDVDGYHVKCAEDLYFDIGSAEPTALLLQDLRYFLEYRERALEEYQGHLTVEDVDDFVSGLLVGFLEEFATRAAEDAYRAWVAVYLSDDNRISEIERNILEDKRIELKLSKEQTSAIEAGIEAGEIQSIG